MNLVDIISKPGNREIFLSDSCQMLDRHIQSRSGIPGLALKASFAAIKGIRPNYIPSTMDSLLVDFAAILDPIWQEARNTNDWGAYFINNKTRVANALLSVTDARVKVSTTPVAKGAYAKQRASANQEVESIVPELVKIIDSAMRW